MAANNINDQDFEDQPVDGDDVVYDDTYEEAETYTEDDSEEWSEGDDVAAQEEQPQQQKKKSSTLTVIIILVVAIVGVLGFMVMTGGSNTPAPEEAAQPQAVIDVDPEQSATDPAAQQAAPVAAAANGQNVFDNPGTVESQLAPTQNAVPAPVADPNAPVVTQDAPPVPSLDDPSAAQPADVVGAIAPSVKPVSDFPTVDSIKKPGADQGAEPVAAVPTNPVETAPVETTDSAMLPVPSDATSGSMTAPAPEMADLSAPAPVPQTVDTGAADARLAVVEGQLTDAQKKIAELEKSLASQASALAAEKEKAAVANSMADNSEEVDSLKVKIAELEAKLAAKAAEPVASAPVPERQFVEQEQYEEVEPVRAAPQKKAAPTVVKQKAPQRPQWTLKSAGSQKAILADKTTGDLKTVRVGDTVSGLGRIVSISDNGTSWVVKGTIASVAE